MVNLTKQGDAIRFTFSNCPHYLNDGTIDVPVNSLTLVVDESDMVTFRKSASNDIFVSTLVSEFGMTKNQLIQWYKDNMVGFGGISEDEVQEMIDESISGKADTSAVTVSINAAVSGKADTSAVTQSINAAVSGKVDSSEFDIKEEVVASALTDLHDSVSALTADIQTITDETLDGLSLKQVTQAEYDAMSQAGTLDESTLYVIVN